MADNVAITAGTGTSILTDDCTTGHAQIVKLAIATDGSATLIPADATNGIDVDVTRVVPGTGVSSLGKQEGEPHASGNTGVLLLGVRNTSHTALTGVAQGDYAPINVDAEGCVVIVGNVGHDSVDADPPIKVGMKAVAHGATPTAVAAADRTDWYANRAGIPFVMGGHPNIQSAEYFASTAATDDNILPAISAGTIYVITCITVACSAANATTPSVRIGFGSTTVPTQGTNQADAVGKIVLSHPGIPAGSGIVKGNGSGIVGIGGDGEELRITCTTPTTSLIVQVDYYTIAS